MITPAYAPTATERVLPRLALDFTTAIADSRVDTARAANTATRFNASGLIEIVNANLPRFDFSPTALVCQGQLIEETRSNLFLNSLIDGTNLATQSVTLSAVTYTLSFFGSGSVAISGGHSATVNGVGDFPNRKTYTFTPTAGSSTFTVSGDVKFAQIEAGAFATSYIPTTTTSLTRNADVVRMTGTNFSDWYNATEGTIVTELSGTGSLFGGVTFDDGTTSNTMELLVASSKATGVMLNGGAGQMFVQPANITAGSTNRFSMAYKNNNSVFYANTLTAGTDTICTVPTVNRAVIGWYPSSAASYLNGHMKKIFYYNLRVLNAEAQAFTK